MHRIKFLAIYCLFISSTLPGYFFFDKKGISFSMGADWEIIEEQDINSVGYSIVAEKMDIEASGTIILSWFQDSTSLPEMLEVYMASMEENLDFQEGELTFEKIEMDTFGTYPCLSTQYSVNILGEVYLGQVSVFHGYKKTLTVHTHGAENELELNQSGFDQLRASLNCEGIF